MAKYCQHCVLRAWWLPLYCIIWHYKNIFQPDSLHYEPCTPFQNFIFMWNFTINYQTRKVSKQQWTGVLLKSPNYHSVNFSNFSMFYVTFNVIHLMTPLHSFFLTFMILSYLSNNCLLSWFEFLHFRCSVSIQLGERFLVSASFKRLQYILLIYILFV